MTLRDLEKILKAEGLVLGSDATLKDDRCRRIGSAVSKYLDAHDAVTSIELMMALHGDTSYLHTDCTMNKHLRNSVAFQCTTLKEVFKMILGVDAHVHSGSQSFSGKTPIYYKTKEGLRKYIQAHAKETSRIVNYDFNPLAKYKPKTENS